MLKWFTKEEWIDIIDNNCVTDDDINTIVRYQNIVKELIKLRDTPDLPVEKLVERLIDLTEGLDLDYKIVQRSRS